MATWNEFRRQEPRMAEAGRRLFYQYGVGLAFLATIRADGGPRLHPMCPVISEDGFFAFIIPSPKRNDLFRDGRYAMQPHPPEANDDAFYMTGMAMPVPDKDVHGRLMAQYLAERAEHELSPDIFGPWLLFEFGVDTVLYSKTESHGGEPVFTVWHAAKSEV